MFGKGEEKIKCLQENIIIGADLNRKAKKDLSHRIKKIFIITVVHIAVEPEVGFFPLINFAIGF